MKSGYDKLFRGYFISIFHITIGSLKIFPPFVGYLIMVSAFTDLLSERKDPSFERAKSCSAFLALLNIAQWFTSASYDFEAVRVYVNLILMLIGAITEIVLYYELLNASARILGDIRYKSIQEKFIFDLRNILIFTFIGQIVYIISTTFMYDSMGILGIVILLICKIYVMSMIRKMYNIFPEEANNM